MKDNSPTVRALRVPSGRLVRAGRVGGLAGGLLGDIALRGAAELTRGRRPRLQDLLLTPTSMRRIADELAHMRGAAMKLGQLLSMDTGEVFPRELTDIFARLRSNAHFMPPSQLKSVLNANWPPGWHKAFRHFDTRPIAAASIGQVHRVQTRDGRDLAIKVQYPGVAESIDSDVANLGMLVRATGLLPKSFDLETYLDEAKRQLHEETDYRREARALVQFGELLADSHEFVVPELTQDWSSDAILAMDYIDSVPIEDLEEASQDIRNDIAGKLVTLTLRELFAFKVMQTDPNFANYRYQPDSKKIVLLDFGASMEIDDHIMEGYRNLLVAGLENDSQNLQSAANALGFFSPNLAVRHRERLMEMIDLVMQTLRESDVFDCADQSLARRLQQDGIALAEDGFEPPAVPMDVLLVQRKLGGVFSLASRLGARLPVRKMLENVL